MREILFRGKRIDNGEWVMSGNIIRFNDEGNGALYYIPQLNERCICKHNEADNIEGFENAMFYKVIPETVGQYTGLTDKNGKKIFEGDILRSTSDYDDLWGDTKECVEIGVVFWDDKTFGWSVRIGEDDVVSLAEFVEGDTTIIGNIHDNPDLLEGGDNGEKI